MKKSVQIFFRTYLSYCTLLVYKFNSLWRSFGNPTLVLNRGSDYELSLCKRETPRMPTKCLTHCSSVYGVNAYCRESAWCTFQFSSDLYCEHRGSFFIRNAHCHREQDVPEDRLIGIDFSAGSCRTVVVFSGVSIFDRRTLVYIRKLII